MYYTNSKRLIFSGQGAKANTLVAVYRDADRTNAFAKTPAPIKSGETWTTDPSDELPNSSVTPYTFRAVVMQGDQMGQPSDPVSVTQRNPSRRTLRPGEDGSGRAKRASALAATGVAPSTPSRFRITELS